MNEPSTDRSLIEIYKLVAQGYTADEAVAIIKNPEYILLQQIALTDEACDRLGAVESELADMET